jgi:hypothetical protein
LFGESIRGVALGIIDVSRLSVNLLIFPRGVNYWLGEEPVEVVLAQTLRFRG